MRCSASVAVWRMDLAKANNQQVKKKHRQNDDALNDNQC